MSNAYVHAERSAKKWGGTPEDYLSIHRWLDQCKAHLADNRHRAVLHNGWGIHLAVEVFGDFITNSANRRVFVKEIGEQQRGRGLGIHPVPE
jgi:NDP-sugar pyrophosphorylase family protein